MLSLLDIAERMQNGPKMSEHAWNMGLFRKMNELTERYGLFYPKDNPVFNLDDDIADSAFQAAIDFLVETGIYCFSTGRIIQFNEDEVLSTIRAVPKEVIIGDGKDTRVLKQRRIEESEDLNHCPGMHAPFTEELAPFVVENFASIPTADYLEGFNFPEVDGREIFGMPIEVYAGTREAAWMRQGVAKAGRPGLAICYYPINTRASVMIAPINPETGLRPSDGIILSVLPGLQVEQAYLSAAIVWEEYGGFKLNGGGHGYVGGFAGDLGGAIIEGIAAVLTGWIAYRDIASNGAIVFSASGVTHEIPADIPQMWATSVWSQALHRHTNHIIYLGGLSYSGPGCELQQLEIAFRAATIPINGANSGGSRQLRATMNASQSPLGGAWAYEVAAAVMRAGLTRQSAGDLVLKIGEKIRGKPPEAPYQDIREFYDLVHHRPLPEFERAYLKVKGELSSLGLDFN